MKRTELARGMWQRERPEQRHEWAHGRVAEDARPVRVAVSGVLAAAGVVSAGILLGSMDIDRLTAPLRGALIAAAGLDRPLRDADHEP